MEKHVKLLFRHDAFEEESIENAWAKKKGEYYQLDNILFYAKEYSLGDLIKTEKVDGEIFANELIEESGHSTIRILFADTGLVPLIRDELRSKECSSELSNYEKLVAVDIPPNISYANIKEYLDEGERKGLWEYEEACIASRHKKQVEE